MKIDEVLGYLSSRGFRLVLPAEHGTDAQTGLISVVDLDSGQVTKASPHAHRERERDEAPPTPPQTPESRKNGHETGRGDAEVKSAVKVA